MLIILVSIQVILNQRIILSQIDQNDKDLTQNKAKIFKEIMTNHRIEIAFDNIGNKGGGVPVYIGSGSYSREIKIMLN